MAISGYFFGIQSVFVRAFLPKTVEIVVKGVIKLMVFLQN